MMKETDDMVHQKADLICPTEIQRDLKQLSYAVPNTLISTWQTPSLTGRST